MRLKSDAGGPADPPDVQGIVDDATKEMKQLIAAQDNVLDAVASEIASMAAPVLVQAGVPGDDVVKMVSEFLTKMHEAVRSAQEKRKEAAAELAVPELEDAEDK
jgi:hypothetical protein